MNKPTPSQVAKNYDHGANFYDDRHLRDRSHRKYRQIERLFRAQLSRGRVLDLGCGTGRLLKQMPPGLGVGIDISLQMLKNAEPHIQRAQADAHHLPFANDAFDVVVAAQGVMRYLETRVVLAEITRVLRPGGRLAVHLFGRVFSVRQWSRLASPLSIEDPQEFTEPAAEAGLRTLAVELWRPMPVYPYALRIPRSLPGQMWTHCVALFEKGPL